MDYRELLREENEAVRERYDLSMERIAAMEEEGPAEPYGCYFKRVAAFIGQIRELVCQIEAGTELTLEELEERNRRLYGDVLPEHYGNSFANPDYAAEILGAELGQLLAFLYTEIRGDIAFAFEMRLEEITILNETFIEVCNLFEQAEAEGKGAPQPQEVRDILYWFVSDYADITVREIGDIESTVARVAEEVAAYGAV